jgi:hypothetical protein
MALDTEAPVSRARCRSGDQCLTKRCIFQHSKTTITVAAQAELEVRNQARAQPHAQLGPVIKAAKNRMATWFVRPIFPCKTDFARG